MRQEGLSCLSLELFFSGYPRMVGLHNFPNLQILQIVGQSVKHIECLRSLPKLKELWIVECGLKVRTIVKQFNQLVDCTTHQSGYKNSQHFLAMCEHSFLAQMKCQTVIKLIN